MRQQTHSTMTRRARVIVSFCATVVALALLGVSCATPVVTPSLSSVAVESSASTIEELPTLVPQPTATPVPVQADDEDDEEDAEPVPPPPPTAVPNPGVTDEVIQIVTINDVVTAGIADDIYLTAQQGIEAWANRVNSNGGLAGRRVELVSVDSGVVNHAELIERICNSDVLALVGSLSLQDGDGFDVLEAPECRIPDFPALANSPARRASDITFVSNPLLNSFYDVSTLRYVADQIVADDPDAIPRASDVVIDQDTFKVWNQRAKEAAKIVGFLPSTSVAPSAGDAVENSARTLIDAEVQTLIWTADAQRLAELLVSIGQIVEDEGNISGPEYVVCDIGCYDPAFVDAVGEFGNSVYLSVPHHLVSEGDTEPEMQEYLFWLNDTHPDAVPTSYGVHAWAAGLLFEETVNQLVGRYTVEEDFSLLNREGLITAARGIDEWNVRTLFGSIVRPASKFPGNCSTVIHLQDGAWERVRPTSVGYDCDPSNLALLEATDDFGLDDAPSLSATNSEAVAGTDTAPAETDAPTDTAPADEPEPDVVDSLEETEELPD